MFYNESKQIRKDHTINDKLNDFLKEKGGNHVSHLFFLLDKEFFWTTEMNVLIVYKRLVNTLFVLGDPIGDESHIQDAVKEFCNFCKSNKLKPIFYQVSAKYMQYYHDSGYRFLKIGEEGLVNLNQFTLEGKKWAKLRTRVNKFVKNSYTFKVVEPPYTVELLTEIKSISDSWLGNQKEKGFSVVSFSESYVNRFPLALLYGPEGGIIAFATLATNYKNTITIDLMRKVKNSPHGTMDVLFIHIFNWARERGFNNCSLGMSPLSNVGNDRNSFIMEKIIRLAYLYGNSKYNFKGLKEFKGKFASNWEPKYLAYKNTFLPITFLQLLFLINRSKPVHSTLEKDRLLENKRDKKFTFRTTIK